MAMVVTPHAEWVYALGRMLNIKQTDAIRGGTVGALLESIAYLREHHRCDPDTQAQLIQMGFVECGRSIHPNWDGEEEDDEQHE